MISKDLPIVLYFVGEEKLSMANNCPPQKIIAVPETKSEKVGEMFFFTVKIPVPVHNTDNNFIICLCTSTFSRIART
jgi:hypothetical protein